MHHLNIDATDNMKLLILKFIFCKMTRETDLLVIVVPAGRGTLVAQYASR